MIQGQGSGAVIMRGDLQVLTPPYNQGAGTNIYLASRGIRLNYSTAITTVR